MGVGAGLYMYDVVVQKVFTFAISSPDEFLFIHTVLLIIRPHRSTTYIDAAYCYRLSSVVCRSVCWSVCVSVCHI